MKKMLSRMTLVGLAVAITAVIGAASVATAANGKPFLLGKNNVATAVSTFVKQGPGPALRLLVRPGQPPMAVNSKVRVANLNADMVDGRHAGTFAAAGHNHDERYLAKSAKAADSELLDGKDSTGFVESATPMKVVAAARVGADGRVITPNSNVVEATKVGTGLYHVRIAGLDSHNAATLATVATAVGSDGKVVNTSSVGSGTSSRMTVAVRDKDGAFSDSGFSLVVYDPTP